MAQKGQPSYADLVHQVLRSAVKPLSVQEILREVDRLRAITTRDPEATIRTALGQGRQLVSIGDGSYGYLPNLLAGSLLRLPLLGKKPANQPLTLPIDVRIALWPAWLDTAKRKLDRPVLLRLPNGDDVNLALEFFGQGVWGCAMPESLRRFLIEAHASEGASLLIRVVDAVDGCYEGHFESPVRKDKDAVARRNDEISDAVVQIMRRNPSSELATWNLAPRLFARGCYRSEPAPDLLETVLNSDGRLVDAGYHLWRLAATVTPEIEALIRTRKRLDVGLSGHNEMTPQDSGESASTTDLRRAMERSLLDFGAFLSKKAPGSAEKVNSLL